MIHNTESLEDIGKDYNIEVGLPGDTQLTMQMLIEEVKAQLGPNGRKGKTNVAAEIATIKQQWMSEWTDILRSDDVPINTYRVIGELERILDKENSIVTHDAGAPRDSIMPFYTATIPHSYVGWGKTTHLGYGIPLMIGRGTKPDKFCLNLWVILAWYVGLISNLSGAAPITNHRPGMGYGHLSRPVSNAREPFND
jgi:thiamine pyrophosphate-dependent acetolactate synthase large subunit-like protein